MPEDTENAQTSLLHSEATIPPLMTVPGNTRYRPDVLHGEASGSDASILNGDDTVPLAENLLLGDVNHLTLQRPDVVSAGR